MIYHQSRHLPSFMHKSVESNQTPNFGCFLHLTTGSRYSPTDLPRILSEAVESQLHRFARAIFTKYRSHCRTDPILLQPDAFNTSYKSIFYKSIPDGLHISPPDCKSTRYTRRTPPTQWIYKCFTPSFYRPNLIAIPGQWALFCRAGNKRWSRRVRVRILQPPMKNDGVISQYGDVLTVEGLTHRRLNVWYLLTLRSLLTLDSKWSNQRLVDKHVSLIVYTSSACLRFVTCVFIVLGFFPQFPSFISLIRFFLILPFVFHTIPGALPSSERSSACHISASRKADSLRVDNASDFWPRPIAVDQNHNRCRLTFTSWSNRCVFLCVLCISIEQTISLEMLKQKWTAGSFL